MNYRQVAELVTRIVGCGLILDGLFTALDWLPTLITNEHGATLTVRFKWMIPFLVMLVIGTIVLVFSQGFADTLVPAGNEESWSPTTLLISAVGMGMALYSSYVPTQFIYERYINTQNVFDHVAGQLTGYVIGLHVFAGVCGLLCWLLPPRLQIKRSLNLDEGAAQEDSP